MERHQGSPCNMKYAQLMSAWWLLGLLNNFVYVVMLSGAESILKGRAGAVLAADIVPTIIIKSTAPLWVHHFPFVVRVGICTACSVAAFLVTGFGGTPTVRLLGVALGSVASGWGEVTFLAMSAFYPGKQVLTAWSSGTGIAGVAGSGWFLLLHTVLGVPAPLTLKLGAAWAGAFFLVYAALLPTPAQAHACVPASAKPPTGEREGGSASPLATSDHSPLLEEGQGGTRDGVPSLDLDTGSRQGGGGGYAPVAATPPAPHGDFQQAQQQQSPKDSTLPVVPRDALQSAASTRNMSLPQRLRVIAPLWVYMLPLFLVYAAEYVVQTGVNSALQFHGLSASQWYVIAGFCYQCGVFVSRSSGTVLPLKLLWPLPLLQVLTLGLFLVQGFTYFIPSPIVMGALTVWVGLLGGATYVNAFRMIHEQVDPAVRELSLGAASTADTLGIVLAAFLSIPLEAAIKRKHGLQP